MLKGLWEKLKDVDRDSSSFVSVIDAIGEYSVPEALSASVTFAQRAYALTVLYDLTHLGSETDLQHLIETFPWILGPEAEYLTANQTLRSVVRTAEDRGVFARQSDRAPIVDAIKPDFVFLTDSTDKNLLVVELKSPSVTLTLENREQLFSYMTFLESRYPDAALKGMLVGNAPGGFRKARNDVEVKSWQQVFLEARAAYTKIIASMLGGYAEHADDPRVADIHVFGGDAVWQMLKKISEKDVELKRLIDSNEGIKSRLISDQSASA